MPTCSFCKKNFKEPRGLTVYGFDGKPMYYCSSKCRRNIKLGRDPKKVNWVKKGKHYAAYVASEDAKAKDSHSSLKQ
jgi:large subunit ribosomal protein L24e